MRIILVGRSAERARLRSELDPTAIEIVGECETLADIDAAIRADAVLLAEDRGQRERNRMEEALTPREIEVLELLADGLPNKAIAERLGISDQTVKFHVASISGKLGAANRTDAVRRALRRGLISL
jgi:NarL family two-component system response regulator YdfI